MFRKFGAIAGDALQYSLLHRYPRIFVSFSFSLRSFFSSPLIQHVNHSRHDSLCDENFMIGNNAVYLEDLYSQWSNDSNSVHKVRILSSVNSLQCCVHYEYMCTCACMRH